MRNGVSCNDASWMVHWLTFSMHFTYPWLAAVACFARNTHSHSGMFCFVLALVFPTFTFCVLPCFHRRCSLSSLSWVLWSKLLMAEICVQQLLWATFFVGWRHFLSGWCIHCLQWLDDDILSFRWNNVPTFQNWLRAGWYLVKLHWGITFFK